MSDELLPGSPSELLPGDPGQTGSEEGSGEALSVVIHPDYIVSWVPPAFAYIVGEKRPLKFAIQRTDGEDVDPAVSPTTIAVYDIAGTLIGSQTPDIESAVAAPTQTLATDYLFSATGTFLVTILASIGNEIVGAEQIVIVRN